MVSVFAHFSCYLCLFILTSLHFFFNLRIEDSEFPLALVPNHTDPMSAFFPCEVFRSAPGECCLTRWSTGSTWSCVSYCSVSCMLLPVKVSGYQSLLALRQTPRTLQALGILQDPTFFLEVSAQARLDLSRWRFWLRKWTLWNVWNRLPSKEEGFDLPLRLASSLSQLGASGGKETNMKHFIKGPTHPSYEFILSLGLSGKRRESVSLLCSQD